MDKKHSWRVSLLVITLFVLLFFCLAGANVWKRDVDIMSAFEAQTALVIDWLELNFPEYYSMPAASSMEASNLAAGTVMIVPVGEASFENEEECVTLNVDEAVSRLQVLYNGSIPTIKSNTKHCWDYNVIDKQHATATLLVHYQYKYTDDHLERSDTIFSCFLIIKMVKNGNGWILSEISEHGAS